MAGDDADGAASRHLCPLRSKSLMGVRVVTGISFGFVFYVPDQIFWPADAGIRHSADTVRRAAAERFLPLDSLWANAA